MFQEMLAMSSGGGGTSLLIDQEYTPTDTTTVIDTGVSVASGVFAVMLQGVTYNWDDYLYIEDGVKTYTIKGDASTQIDVVVMQSGNLGIQLKNASGVNKKWHLYLFG